MALPFTTFLVSIGGIIAMLLWRSYELRSGEKTLAEFRTGLDAFFHVRMQKMNHYFSLLNKDTFGIVFSVVPTLFVRISRFVRKEIRFVYGMIHAELKERSVVKKKKATGPVSFFLQNVSEHKKNFPL